jgi:hypothetical protein
VTPTGPLRLFLIAWLSIWAAGASAAAPEWLLGEWVLNSERTHELQPKQSGGSNGLGSTSISVGVGGVGIPMPGQASQTPVGGARDPRVLRCEAMTVSELGDSVHFVYQGVGEETMKPGNDQGRKTSWNRSKLTQKYSTTSRAVTKTYRLEEDGSLEVKVKLAPKGAKSVTHVRVFERPTAGMD